MRPMLFQSATVIKWYIDNDQNEVRNAFYFIIIIITINLFKVDDKRNLQVVNLLQ